MLVQTEGSLQTPQRVKGMLLNTVFSNIKYPPNVGANRVVSPETTESERYAIKHCVQ